MPSSKQTQVGMEFFKKLQESHRMPSPKGSSKLEKLIKDIKSSPDKDMQSQKMEKLAQELATRMSNDNIIQQSRTALMNEHAKGQDAMNRSAVEGINTSGMTNMTTLQRVQQGDIAGDIREDISSNLSDSYMDEHGKDMGFDKDQANKFQSYLEKAINKEIDKLEDQAEEKQEQAAELQEQTEMRMGGGMPGGGKGG